DLVGEVFFPGIGKILGLARPVEVDRPDDNALHPVRMAHVEGIRFRFIDLARPDAWHGDPEAAVGIAPPDDGLLVIGDRRCLGGLLVVTVGLGCARPGTWLFLLRLGLASRRLRDLERRGAVFEYLEILV